jgi:hypothetical protein
MWLHQAWAACQGCCVINDKRGQELYKLKRQNVGYKLSANLADGSTLWGGTVGYFVQPHLPVYCYYCSTWKVCWSYTESWCSVRYTVWRFYHRNGCATSEDLFWKLDALQSFIRDLHWPDAEFRQHLEQRLKLMACDMIESCIQRYALCQQWFCEVWGEAIYLAATVFLQVT